MRWRGYEDKENKDTGFPIGVGSICVCSQPFFRRRRPVGDPRRSPGAQSINRNTARPGPVR